MAKVTLTFSSVKQVAVIGEALQRMRDQEVKTMNALQATNEEKRLGNEKITLIDQILFGMGE